MADLDDLRCDLRDFVAERDWAHFHDPKSLLLALMAEVGELCEVFQWIPAADAAERTAKEPMLGQVSDEIADVLINLLHLADAVGVDPVEAATRNWNGIGPGFRRQDAKPEPNGGFDTPRRSPA